MITGKADRYENLESYKFPSAHLSYIGSGNCHMFMIDVEPTFLCWEPILFQFTAYDLTSISSSYIEFAWASL